MKRYIYRVYKNLLRQLFPHLNIIKDYIYDYKKYKDYSFKNKKPNSDKQLKFRLLQRAHSFEKGLSLASVKLGFGKDKLYELVSLIEEYRTRGLPRNAIEYQKAIAAFQNYMDYHNNFEFDDSFDFAKSFQLEDVSTLKSTMELKKEDIQKNAKGDFLAMSHSRYSTRQFSDQAVDIDQIKEAIKIAQKYPSVCNRQTAEVFLVENEALKAKVLNLQGGNKGFGEDINKLLIVTASLECFDGGKERNQGFIDGGLFAMSLMHALHYKGLATCPLNWSANRIKDQKLRDIVAIPDANIVIMLIAVGHFKDEVIVATSPRRNFDEVFSMLK